MDKQVRAWIALARKAGWRVEFGRHVRLYPTDKAQPPITLPTSPGENRALKNAAADLRRAGLIKRKG